MNEHRYILEPYKGSNSRYSCPYCLNKEKTFVRYVDTQTGIHIHASVGRCNREDKCGYHLTPRQYFTENGIDTFQTKTISVQNDIKTLKKPVSFIPNYLFKDSLKSFETNHFVKFLIEHFGIKVTNELISKYFIGTSTLWPGATVFWQIDAQGRVRTGKIMLYNPNTGKRVKEPFSHISWVHMAQKQPEFVLSQCLFGEHLLKAEANKPVAVVESEKTAIIASAYLPQFTWVATCGSDGLSIDKCHTLNNCGQQVVLFPDLSKHKEGKETAFEKWTRIANNQLLTFSFSDLIERKANEKEQELGLDIADYLIQFNLQTFLNNEHGRQTYLSPVSNVNKEIIEKNERLGKTNMAETDVIPNEKHKAVLPYVEIEQPYFLRKSETAITGNWDKDIKELEEFFSKVILPASPIRLDQASTIMDMPLFIENSLATVIENNGNRTYKPYLDRLIQLKNQLINLN